MQLVSVEDATPLRGRVGGVKYPQQLLVLRRLCIVLMETCFFLAFLKDENAAHTALVRRTVRLQSSSACLIGGVTLNYTIDNQYLHVYLLFKDVFYMTEST